MHPNPIFRQTSERDALAFAARRGFGLLTISTDGAPAAAQVPFAITEDGDGVEFHLARSNPVARALAEGDRPALLTVSGPDAYVSPDWYGLGSDQVPTWNYVAVALTGRAALAAPERLRDHLARVTAAFEARLAPKPPWSIAKMPEEALRRMMRAIVPATLTLETIESTWKLNQNKPSSAQAGAAAGIAAAPIGSEPAARIADLMRPERDDDEG